MLAPFRFESPTEIRSAIGARCQLSPVLEELGAARVLLLASERFLNTVHGAELRELLGAKLVAAHGRGKGEPNAADAHALAALARSHDVDCFVVAGAGTVFGLAKCAVVDLASGGQFERYSWSVDHKTGRADVPQLPAGVAPIVALPTTAGSGSDVNGFGSVRDQGRGEKIGIRGRAVAPRFALLDAELTASADRRLTAGSGLNAFSHCLEVMYSRQSQPISRALALEGARLLGECLPRCVRDGNDLEARQGALIGSALSSMAFANAMLGLHSVFCHALSAVSDVVYTDAQSVIFSRAILYRPEIIEPAAAAICDAIGLGAPRSKSAAERLADWGRALGGPQRLRDIGVRKEELPALAKAAFGDRCLPFDPRPVPGTEALLEVYERAW